MIALMNLLEKRPFRPTIFLFILACLLPLVGCQQELPIPTRMAVAILGDPTPTPEPDLPPTWTPSPTEVTIMLPFASQVQATRALTTPIIPTNTPRPTDTPTPTPEPSPTVYQLALPTPSAAGLGPSKMGLHVINFNDENMLEFVRRGQPAVMKAVGDFGWLAEVRRLSPNTTIVGRVDDPSHNYHMSPQDAARVYVESQLDQYLANPAVDFWEGYNEPNPGLERMGWYARFEQERIRLMASYGFRTAIGGFSTGVPELDEFALFLPAFETLQQHQGILTLHEYGAPDLTYLYGDPLPGYPAYPDRGSLKFRYRWYYRELLEPNGLVVPLVISEAGVDGVIGNRPGPPGTGWYDFQDYWVAQGWGRTGAEAFINQLAWYDYGVRQDDYVIGFTIFTAGGIGHWLNYDINELLPQLTDYVVRERNR
jgi:hypothetical protein